MSQNLISAHLTAEQWANADQAITTLEDVFGQMVVGLTPIERQRVVKMGDGSEAFCRQALDLMAENTSLLPRSVDVEEMRRDLASHDALNPRLVRLRRLIEKANDTDTALGSDVMTSALQGYAFLKIAGKGEGLHGLRKVLSKRFDNGPRKVSATPEPVADPA